MEMTEIRRCAVGEIEADDAQIMNLAAAAQELLGYSVLAKVAKPPEQPASPLMSALRSLEIDILNAGDVLAYQKERMIERTALNCREWMKTAKGLEKLHSYDRFGGPAWTRTKIKEYREPVPEFVLAKAIQIKKAFPECEIWVEGLESHPDPFLIVGIPDSRGEYYAPLEEAYVEVWEEPRFEGRSSSIIGTDIPF